MAKDGKETLDMTGGHYRRQYSGFKTGQRINAVSLAAEAWFWRVHSCACDDFGNTYGDPELILAETRGRRLSVTSDQVGCWLREMSDADLIRFYDCAGERYLHVVGFTARQPRAKNGRRVRRYPESPHESKDGTNGVIRGNPGESGGHNYHDHDQDHHQNNPPPEDSGVPADAASPVALTFPTVGGNVGGPKTWDLTEAYVAELSGAFPGLDVLGECRKSLVWVKAAAGNRKTAGGMKRFLLRWMGTAQNQGRGRQSSPNGKHGTAFEAKEAVVMAALADRKSK